MDGEIRRGAPVRLVVMIAPSAIAASKRAASRRPAAVVRRARTAGALWIALAAGSALAAEPTPVPDATALRLLRAVVVAAPDAGSAPDAVDARAAAPGYRLPLELAVIAGSGWSADDVLVAARQAGKLLAQCGVAVGPLRLSEFDGPARYRDLATPVSRDLARRANLGRPALFFVAGTRHRPAFDAEAVGRANSRTRPEMADTVWITAGTRDLPLVIAHELVHVLADSGEHSNEPANLMREETAPENARLTTDQCRAIVTKAQANGLLQRAK